MLVRRHAFEAIGGFDEDFFLYCEDTDICRRLRDAGHEIRFEPAARSRTWAAPRRTPGHAGDRRPQPRALRAQAHAAAAARFQAAGVALGEVTHALAALSHPASRRGHMAALRAVLRRAPAL